MAVMKCKMCGGDLVLEENSTVATCEYCSTVQTVPAADNEKKMTLFARANRLRFGCEFDKASGIYESIVGDFPEEAEAYWGLVLCKYGIEYVDDPATGKKIPTCHRTSFDSVLEDDNFQQAMELSDVIAQRIYREEAKNIERLRRDIIEISGKESPYDIFICYKETDFLGSRTLDSVLAQDIYTALTEKGYRVFFSRISLEDKLGVAYEPYIFAALHSAKVMLAVGTDYEHYNAVWVKNEWSRYLQLIAAGEKKVLIPCYKNIDAYDMPKEFARLQAQDLGKIGAMQDLLRGIDKILKTDAPAAPATSATSAAPAGGADALVTRGNFSLEDGSWSKADEFFDRALDMDPMHSSAYLGKFMVSLQISGLDALENLCVNIKDDKNFSRALQFASGPQKLRLEAIRDKMEKKQLMQQVAHQLSQAATEKATAYLVLGLEGNTSWITGTADGLWYEFLVGKESIHLLSEKNFVSTYLPIAPGTYQIVLNLRFSNVDLNTQAHPSNRKAELSITVKEGEVCYVAADRANFTKCKLTRYSQQGFSLLAKNHRGKVVEIPGLSGKAAPSSGLIYPIEALILRVPTYQVLKRIGITNTQQLTSHTAQEILALPGFSKQILEELTSALETKNLHFKT